MVYTRIVQPGIRKKYHYVPGERTLFRVEGTIIPKVWKTAVLVALLIAAIAAGAAHLLKHPAIVEEWAEASANLNATARARRRDSELMKKREAGEIGVSHGTDNYVSFLMIGLALFVSLILLLATFGTPNVWL